MASIGTTLISSGLQRYLDAEIKDGEHILWAGKSSPAQFFKACLVPSTVSSLPALLLFLIITLKNPHWALGFLVIIAFLIVTRSALFTYLGCTKRVFAVTENRAIIVTIRDRKFEQPETASARSFYAADITDLHRTGDPHGIGNVAFAPSKGLQSYLLHPTSFNGFFCVANAGAVEELVRKIIAPI